MSLDQMENYLLVKTLVVQAVYVHKKQIRMRATKGLCIYADSIYLISSRSNFGFIELLGHLMRTFCERLTYFNNIHEFSS